MPDYNDFKSCHRLNIPGHVHELTFSCFHKHDLLLNERFCRFLAEAIIAAKEFRKFDLWAYVFMPNHVHLLIKPNQEFYSISDILLSIKQSTSRKALIALRKENSALLKKLATGQKHTPFRFWQDGGGYDRNIAFTETIINAINYIHNNPVRRGLVNKPDDWEWSSAKDWADSGTGPILIDKSNLAAF